MVDVDEVITEIGKKDKLRRENIELKAKIYVLKQKIKTWKERANGLYGAEYEEWYGS